MTVPDPGVRRAAVELRMGGIGSIYDIEGISGERGWGVLGGRIGSTLLVHPHLPIKSLGSVRLTTHSI